MHMKVTFWGVRGSIPCPGPKTVRYGGNTSCVSVDLGGDKFLVLDAGSGIRELGKSLARRQGDIFVLVTHAHWDHIQGFPFFAPIYQPERRVFTFPTRQGQSLFCHLIAQMDGAHFPVTPASLPSHFDCITDGEIDLLCDYGFCVSRTNVNHPGGAFGFRIQHAGRSVVYIPDNELDPPPGKPRDVSTEEIVDFCRGADLLIHDAQYLEPDMPLKRGWGHSVVSQVRELAARAEVKHLALFHHDPERTDDELDAIQSDSRAWFARHRPETQCTVAHEGWTVEL